MPDTVRRRGVVTFHDLKRGFGKIHSEGIEYFFHVTVCRGRFHELTEGIAVTFDGKMVDKGPRAFEVQRDRTHHLLEALDAADTRGNR